MHTSRDGHQQIQILDPVHPVLKNPNAPKGVIEFFPAHPHEGGIGAPAHAPSARVIAKGVSMNDLMIAKDIASIVVSTD